MPVRTPLDLSSRNRRPERMDDPALDAKSHERALRGLERINAWSASVGTLWEVLRRLSASNPSGPLRVLDVASGGGDVPIGLWRKARRDGVEIEVVGCDVSETAMAFARRRARRDGARVEFRVVDALRDELPAGFDVVTCSLFLHHLDEEDVVRFLASAGKAARRAVVVDDLERSRAGFFLARVATRFLSASDVVHADGPLSVEGAFTVEEARGLAARAGLAGARIETRWPFRWLLTWTAP